MTPRDWPQVAWSGSIEATFGSPSKRQSYRRAQQDGMRNAAQERSDLPGVGDFVALRLAAGDGQATIEAVLPRTSALVRKAAGESRPQLLAANIDVVFIMTTPDADLNLPRLERYLALVRDSGAAPVIVVNKADLAHDAVEITGQIAGIAPGVPIHVVSARGRDRIDDLERYFDGNRTIAFVGSSGVGKSTLTNLLLGRTAQATQEVRANDSRGRHTTTHRQLFTRPLKAARLSTRPGCGRWKSGIPRQKQLVASKISKPWQPGASSAIAVMTVNRHALCELLSSEGISMRDVLRPIYSRTRIETERTVTQRPWRHRQQDPTACTPSISPALLLAALLRMDRGLAATRKPVDPKTRLGPSEMPTPKMSALSIHSRCGVARASTSQLGHNSPRRSGASNHPMTNDVRKLPCIKA